MKKRFLTNQCFLSGLTFHFSILLLFSSVVAAQLLPNPNYGSIIVDNPVSNTVKFENLGDITNNSIIYNYDDIWNYGDILNYYIVDNSGTFNNESHFSNKNYMNNSGTFNNVGSTSASGWIDNSGNFNNVGSMSGDYNMYNMLTGTINNKGYFEADCFDNYGTIDNSGYFETFGPSDNMGTINNLGTYKITSGLTNLSGIINNSGTFDSAWGYLDNQGTLKGTGTFIGDLINDSGTVAPGNSPGTMTIDGDFTLDGSGILDIEIGGFTPGLFDILDITGMAYLLDGNINFSFLDGYDIITDIGPLESKELTFLKADYIDSFKSVIKFNFMSLPYFHFDVFQQDNGLVFEATNLVPAPPAILLGSIGLAYAGWRLRRRRIV